MSKDTAKRFTGRMTELHDTTENWNALRGFIPYAGEIIIYDDWKEETVDGKKRYIPGVKIGDGLRTVQDLAFCNAWLFPPPEYNNIPENGFLPNVLYVLGTISGNVVFTLDRPIEGKINHYYWTFDIGDTVPEVTWPVQIVSWNRGSAPTLVANKHYEISVLKGVGAYMEV